MASYGFGDSNEGWKESRKHALAESLNELIQDMEGEGKFIGLKEGEKQFVEFDERYKGVAIRNKTHMKKND